MRYATMSKNKVCGIVLALLTKEEKMHGYRLTQKFKEVVRRPVKEGILYPVLYFLEADGMLTPQTEYIGKRIRKYYSLSAKAKAMTNGKRL